MEEGGEYDNPLVGNLGGWSNKIVSYYTPILMFVVFLFENMLKVLSKYFKIDMSDFTLFQTLTSFLNTETSC